MDHPRANRPANKFADARNAFQDGKRSPLVHVSDRRYRGDLFERFALTFERLGDLSGKDGLDIGCGSGHYLAEALRRNARHVVGLDPALGMLELARRRVNTLGQADRVEFVADYFPKRTPTGPFDFAIVVGVLDYVADPEVFLRALRAILAGTAVVSFPAKHWYLTPIRRIRCRLRNCTVYFYDEGTIRSIAQRAGFGAVDLVRLDGAGSDYLVFLKP